MRRRKNIGFLFETLGNLDKNKYNLELNGAVFQDFGSELNKLLKENIGAASHTAFVSEKKIVDLYDSFDAFLMPSLYEGFGLGIIEAQARGLPVIIYKGGKIPKETRKYCMVAKDPKHAAEILEKE